MPLKPSDTPEKLRPYQFYGLDLLWRSGDGQATGTCPWCGREEKFTVNLAEGLWRCWVCGEGSTSGGGNVYTFIKLLWEKSLAATPDEWYEAMRLHRGLLSIETLKSWGVCRSILDGECLLPGYSVDKKLCNVYRYVKGTERWLLLAGATLNHGLFGTTSVYDPKKPNFYICEGPWDGMALWETLAKTRIEAEGAMLTGNLGASVLVSSNVIAVPGCNVFSDAWKSLFSGKRVKLLFDSDHPKAREGAAAVAPAGYTGMQRVTRQLSAFENPPAEIAYMNWGPDGYNPDQPSGFDVRDVLISTTSTVDRVKAVAYILDRITPAPTDWFGDDDGYSLSQIEPKQCDNYGSLTTAWRKAMKWTEGLDRGLSVALAAAASTMTIGDQLWIKLMGPASCGKSTLAEGLNVCKKYVKSISTLRGFHSGDTNRDGSEDNSLIALVNGKTLITKDGDTLLQSPNASQILSEARDIYDGASRSYYRKKGASRDHENIRFTWILCGTASLRALDSSELGERFLDCVIMESIPDDLEDEVLDRVANRAVRNAGILANCSADTRYDPDLAEAMALTGGYVQYLRDNIERLMPAVEASEDAVYRCKVLGKFIAYMRARPSNRQHEKAEREFAARLVSQLTRLAMCMAIVLNRKSLDTEVMRRVTRVALDTCRGRSLEIVKVLAPIGEVGMEPLAIASRTNQQREHEYTLLRFLKAIGALDYYRPESVTGLQSNGRYRLAPRFARLYEEVMHNANTTVQG